MEHPISNSKIGEKVCSLVVTKVLVAPQVLGLTPCWCEFPGFNCICAFGGRRRSRRARRLW
jgi:hypothetical protein